MNTLKFILSSFLFVFLIACNNSSSSDEKQVIEETKSPKEEVKAVEPISPPIETAPPPPSEVADEPKTAIRGRTENTFAERKEPSPKVIAPSEPAPSEAIVQNKKPSPEMFNPPKKTADVVESTRAEPVAKPQKVVLKQFSHDAWDQLLRANVSATGKVNYKGFKAQQSTFDAYLQQLADNPVQADWSRNEKMAYWINAYNAFTIKLILDNYPVKSIMDLHGGKPWDVQWIKLGTKTYSLNNIEHDILRPKYKDARIHFAVNCAAKSCPPVLNRAWTAANLNSNFQKQATSFINNTTFNKISADKIQVSKIFEWYAVDFGNLINYLNKFSSTQINSGAKIEYIEYDWKLNE